jgi:cell division protein FtsW
MRRTTLNKRAKAEKLSLLARLKEPGAAASMFTPKVISDKILFTLAIGLVLFGIVMVYSASAVLAAEKFEHQYYFLIRQSIWAALALVALMVTMNLDYRIYQKPAIVYFALGVSVVLLIAVFFFPAVNGAHRWIRIKLFSVQPSEIAKFALILFLAHHLDKRIPTGIKRFWLTFVPCGLVAAFIMGLVAKEPDLGMALMLGVALVTMFFVVKVPWKHQACLGVAIPPAIYWLLFRVDWRIGRMMAFLDPWADPQGRGFQVIQSLVAIGSGGVSGVGFAQGKQKLFFLPEPHTDFIFSHIGEELGLVGTGILVLAFAIIFWRGLRITLKAPDSYAMLLSIGIVATIAVQSLFNISVSLGLLPVKGMPLPLISYGGSSLLLTLAQIGVLLNIAQKLKEDGE